MKIACQSCQAKYTIADEKVLGKVVKIRCKKCGATIVVNGQDTGDAGGAGMAAEDPTEMGSSAGGDVAQGTEGEGWTVNVADDDQRTMTTHQVVAEFAKGTISDETYCWRDGMGDWLPLKEIEELASACGLNAAGTFARQAPTPGPSSVRPAAAGSGGGVFGAATAAAAASPGSQRNAAATARRAGGRAPAADLFGAAAEAGGENDVMTSAPQNPNAGMQEGDGKMTGQRNENSVLFSLNALTAGAPKKEETTAQGDGSGLIDIRALSSSMASTGGPKKTNHADDIMNLGGGGAFSAALAAPVLTAPPLNSMDSGGGSEAAQGNKKLLLIAMAIGAVAICAMFGMYLAMKPSASAVAAVPSADTSAAATGAAPSATTPPPPATVAANDPTATAPATDPVKATAPSVGVGRRSTTSGGQSAPAPFVPPAAPAPPSAPKSLEQMMGGAVGGAKAPPPAAAGGGSTDPFDRGAAAGALGAVDVSGCKKGDGPTGPGHVSITFSPSGSVATAIVDQPPYAGTAVGGCVAGKFRGARVPPFGGGPTKVGKSFVIN